MDLYEVRTHSFIVKVWLEEVDGCTVTWRGYITHVPSDRRRHVSELKQVLEFIAEYLDGTRAQLELRPKPAHWWRPGRGRSAR